MQSPTRPTRVIVVDDHPLMREGLRYVIGADPRLELIGEAGQGEVAIALIRQYRPDVAVLDVNLPDMTGLDVLARLRAAQVDSAIVILTMLHDEQVFNQAMNLGVLGFVLKENAVSEIIQGVLAAAAGAHYVSASLSGFLLQRRDRAAALRARQPSLADLTTAERRILRRIAEKKTSKEIASEFSISPRTVESHRARISTKLGLHGSNSLLQFALEHRHALADLA